MSEQVSYTMGPSMPALVDKTMGQVLAEAAHDMPDRVAIIFGCVQPERRKQWTYSEMYAEALRVARALSVRFEPGERVAVWSQNTPEWVFLEFGAALAGVILVTVNPSYQSGELKFVLNQSKCSGILVMPEYRGNQMLEAVSNVRSDCPALREVIRFDQWEQFLDSGDESIVLPDPIASDAAMIQYTSGTTGFPKGAVLHHRGLVNNGAHTLDRMGVKEGDVWLSTMPFFHTAGCGICVLGAVAQRATQVIVEAFDPGVVLDLIETYKVNAFVVVPTMLIAMLEHPSVVERDLSSLRAISAGGATVPAALVEQFEKEFGAKFTIVFGQTESSPISSMTRPSDSLDDKSHTLGGPMPHVEIKVVDPQTGETAQYGELGEYCTRGYHVMHEYFEMPEATRETIDSEGWLHTGDLCSMDERGYCKIEGRLKDMIIRGGENIYPRELEELLFKHPSVGSVAVVGVPDERFGESVAAFLKAAPGETPDRDTLFAYLRTSLSPQKTPKLWFLLKEFPMTGSGKIQKFVLRQQWIDGDFEEMG